MIMIILIKSMKTRQMEKYAMKRFIWLKIVVTNRHKTDCIVDGLTVRKKGNERNI